MSVWARRQWRPKCAGSVWLATLLGWLVCCPIEADVPARSSELSREVNFSIAPQPLATALLQFSDQSGLQLLTSDAGISKVWSNGIRGRLPVEDALRRLLLSTRLEFEVVSEDTVALVDHVQVRKQRTRLEPAAAMQPVALTVDGAPSAPVLDQVLVTAQKREESLQDAPLSIAVLSGRDLEARGVSSLTDMLSGGVPSLRISTFIGRTSTLSTAMRGINSGDATQISRDSGVGIYLDGVYLGRTQGLGGELLEIERMEVLKGPQGTLFGRNAVGGAVHIISRKPSGELDFAQTLGVRSHEGFRLVSRLDLPRTHGISVKLDGALNEREGLVRNPDPSAWDFSEYKRWGVRGQVLWDAMENFTALYSYDFARDRSTPYYLHITALSPTARPLAPMFDVEPRPVKQARTAVPLRPSVGDVGGHSLTLSWLPGGGTAEVKLISAYREIDQSQFDNWAGTTESFRPDRPFGRTSVARVRQHQLSEELQVIMDVGRFSLLGGAYYLDERSADEALEFFSNQFNADGTAASIVRRGTDGVDLTRASVNHTESTALFFRGTWRPPVLADRLSASVALRYTNDEKAGRLTSLYGAPPPPTDRYSLETSRVDPSASIAFQVNPDVNAYLRWDVGYRAGGASSRSLRFRSFGPEEIESWEVGLKSELWNHAARVNVALYAMSHRHMQVNFFSPENPVNGETMNADRPASIQGAEVDIAVTPSSRLKLSGSYAFTRVKIPPQPNPFTGEVVRLSPVYSPRHAGSVALDYDIATFDFGTLSLYADASYTGPQYAVINDRTLSPPSTVVNGRITLGDMPWHGAHVSIDLWGKNLFDRRYELSDFTSSIGPLVVFGEPRSVGLDATLRF